MNRCRASLFKFLSLLRCRSSPYPDHGRELQCVTEALCFNFTAVTNLPGNNAAPPTFREEEFVINLSAYRVIHPFQTRHASPPLLSRSSHPSCHMTADPLTSPLPFLQSNRCAPRFTHGFSCRHCCSILINRNDDFAFDPDVFSVDNKSFHAIPSASFQVSGA